jgi:DNA-binding NtrC family response regulator
MAIVARDASMEAAIGAIAAGLLRGSVVVRGESGVGRTTLIRAAHERAFRGKQALHAVVCSSLDATRVAALPTSGTILLEGADQLAPEVRDAVVLALSSAPKGALRVAATSDRNLDARYGALGLWLSAGSATIVEVPPLRQRLDELVPLANELARAWTGRIPLLSTAALARLRSHPWPGNVSELEVAMERAMLLAGDGEIQAEHLPGDAMRSPTEGRLREHVDSVERDAIARALAETNHNQTNAAKKLGLSRRALIYKMEKYGMKPPPDSVKSVRQKR